MALTLAELRLGATITPMQQCVLLQIAALGCLVEAALSVEERSIAEQLSGWLCTMVRLADGQRVYQLTSLGAHVADLLRP